MNIDTQIIELAKHLQKSVELTDTDALKIACQMMLIKKQYDLNKSIKDVKNTIDNKEINIKLPFFEDKEKPPPPPEEVFKPFIRIGSFCVGWMVENEID